MRRAQHLGQWPGDVEAVARAVHILRSFTPDRPEWSVSDLARHLGLAKSVVSRILATLRRHGMVVQDPATRRFRLALCARRLAEAAESGLQLERRARPLLQRLAESTSAVVLLTRLADSSVSVVAAFAGRPWEGMRVVPRVPLHAGASNRVLLAHLPLEGQQEYLRGPLPRFTERTVCDPRALRALLADIRQRGFDWSRSELIRGAAGLAVPILSRDGDLLGALSVVAPERRFGSDPPLRLVDELRRAAADLAAHA